MKVYAESQVPGETPFLHLGYLAASEHIDAPAFTGLFGGAMLCLAGLVVLGKGRASAAGTRRKVLLSLAVVLPIMGIGAAVLTLVLLSR